MSLSSQSTGGVSSALGAALTALRRKHTGIEVVLRHRHMCRVGLGLRIKVGLRHSSGCKGHVRRYMSVAW